MIWYYRGAIDKIVDLLETHDPDITYLSSYSFSSDYLVERKTDSLRRSYRILTDPLQFARTVNLMLTFISGIIVNRERFLKLPHEPVREFLGTNLIQMGWTLPLFREHRKSICVWELLVAGRSNNSGGYNIARVFGVALKQVSERILPLQPKISQALSNAALRRWFPGSIFDFRSKGATRDELEELRTLLTEAHRGNWRLRVFVMPVLYLPIAMARGLGNDHATRQQTDLYSSFARFLAQRLVPSRSRRRLGSPSLRRLVGDGVPLASFCETESN